MSAVNAKLDADHGERRDQERMATLFRAHSSPSFHQLVKLRASASCGNPPSLATCEKVPTSDPDLAENQPTEYELVEHFNPAREAIQASISRSRPRQRKVLALIKQDEAPHALRLANCRRKSVRLECPTMAGGCGSEENYVPVHCDSRLCESCMRRKQGKVAQQYRGVVDGWDHPTMLRLSLPQRVEPERLETAIDALRGAFGRLRRRVVPAAGSHQGKRWVWRRDGGAPADHYWKSKLTGSGAFEQARRWQKRYVDQGRGIPFEEIASAGFYGIDVKQGDDGTLNVHMHILADIPYLPQAALSALWDDIIGAPAVDIRRIDQRGQQDAESALMEVVGYAAKPPQFESVDDEAAYLTALKGSKLIQPFGALHGNTPQVHGLLRCCDCETAPAYWNYLGVLDGCHETALVGSAPDGDRPPPA